MKKSERIKSQMAAELNAAEALDRLADAEQRAMTPAEDSKFRAHLAKQKELHTQWQDQVQLEAHVEARKMYDPNATTDGFVYNHDGTQYKPGYNPNNGFNWGNAPKIVAPKLAAFKGPNANRDAYDAGLWLKANILHDGEARTKLESRRGQSWLASQNESSPVDGGYLVPAELSNAIIVSREQVGAMRKLAQIYTLGSDNLDIPKRTGGLTVYYPGEEGAITDSDVDFGRISLVPKKRAVLTYISNELKDDAIVPIMDLLMQEMGHAFALKEDNEGILGDGTSTYGLTYGIKPAVAAATASVSTAATGHDTWAELDITDFAGVMSKIADQYRVPGQLSWLCSAAFKWQVMDRLAISSNGALSQVFVDGQPQERFLGYPVVVSDRAPTTAAASTICAYFGNFPRAVALGERTGVRLAMSEHVAFTTDRLALRGTTRYDINVHEAGTASVAGAIAGLKTAA